MNWGFKSIIKLKRRIAELEDLYENAVSNFITAERIALNMAKDFRKQVEDLEAENKQLKAELESLKNKK